MLTLATPYYGYTTRPQGRPENVFIKILVDPQTGEFSQSGLCVWDPKRHRHLPEWLSHQGINTLLCNDKPHEPEQFFEDAGVAIFSRQHSDLQEMVSDWRANLTTGGDTFAA